MNPFLQVDQDLFQVINSDWSNATFDFIFPRITDLHQSPVFWAVMAALIFWQAWYYPRKTFRGLLVLVIAVTLSDQICSNVLKPIFNRERPTPTLVKLRTHVHYGLSFPSTHAANVFAAAVVIGGAVPAAGLVAFPAAFLVAYSRVYVGVHYPLDVLGGAIIGLIIGLLFWGSLRHWVNFIPPSQLDEGKPWLDRKNLLENEMKKKNPEAKKNNKSKRRIF